MSANKARQFHLFGWLTAIGTIFQGIGLIRYIYRLPDDWIGIVLYSITLLAFAAVSIGSFIQARQKEDR